MKKLLISGFAIASLAVAGAANAADLGPRPAYKAPPPPVVAPVYNWTGFYVGGHFGGGWARKAWEERSDFDKGFGDICFEDFCAFDDLSETAVGQQGFVGSHNAIGPLGGFQAGFNWQPLGSHWVFGIEGQYSFADLKGDHQNSVSGAAFPEEDTLTSGTINDRFSTKVTGIATIAGRIGITSDVFDRTLFYVKGGAAYARDQYRVNSQFSATSCDLPEAECAVVNGTGSWSANQNRWGWMAGIGLEFGLFGNWSAKIEYDYLGFGSRNVSLNGSATAFCDGNCEGADSPTTKVFSRNFSINENIQLIKLGLNYRFNWGKGKAPVVASY